MPTSKTKKLAAQLGLLPSKRKTAEQESSSRKKKKQGQLLSYVIVIDFESTCWENKKGQQEIIEFPAILLNLQTGNIESEFHQYVLPEENPLLSDFCKQLTGITQDQVNSHGVPLKTCLYLFSRWIERLKEEKQFKLMEPGQAYNEDMTLCAFVTWTDWDFGVCLHYECRRKQIRKPGYFNQWIDVRALYKTFYDRRPSGLNGALEDLGITFAGRQHSGIDDARNTAKLCYRMVKDGCKLNITKCIQQQVHKAVIKPPCVSESTSNPPTTSCTAISSAQSSSPAVQCEKNSLGVSPSPNNQPGMTWASVASPQAECTSNENVVEGLTSVKLNSHMQDWDNHSVDEEFMRDLIKELDGDSGITTTSDRVDLNPSGKRLPQQASECCVSGLTNLQFLKPLVSTTYTHTPFQKPFTRTAFPAIHGHTPSRTECISHITPVTLLLREATVHQDSKQSFKRASKSNCQSTCVTNSFTGLPTTPIEYQGSVSSGVVKESPPSHLKACPGASASACATSQCGSSSGIFRTPNTSEWIRFKSQCSNSSLRTMTTPQNSSVDNIILANSVKVTPPLCSCGRRAKRKSVCTPGPNEGKPFFVCPNSSGSNKRQGCGFFKWEYNLLAIPQENSSSDFKVIESEYFE